MPYLTGCLEIVDANGNRIDRADREGDYPPFRIRIGSGISATWETDGAVNTIILTGGGGSGSGIAVVENDAQRDGIPSGNRTAGMLVAVLSSADNADEFTVYHLTSTPVTEPPTWAVLPADATALRGARISLAPPTIVGQALRWNGTQAAWSRLTAADIDPAFAIASFGPNRLVEIGASVNHPSFSAIYTGYPDSVHLTNSDTSENVDASSAPATPTSATNFTSSTFGHVLTHTLSAVLGEESATRAATTTWAQYMYWGGGAAGLNTSAAVKALANRQIRTNASTGEFVASVGEGQKFYIAIRAAFSVQIKIGSFVTTFIERTVPVTNDSGVTEDYKVYESGSDSYGSNFLAEVVQLP
jgi:hypothetical protein